MDRIRLGCLDPPYYRFFAFKSPRSEAEWQEISDVQLEGHAIPDLDVRVNAGVTRFGAEGVVGLNFFNQFREVCFEVETRRLTLRL